MSRPKTTNTKQKRNSTKTVKPRRQAKQVNTVPDPISFALENTHDDPSAIPGNNGRQANKTNTLSRGREGVTPELRKRPFKERRPKWVGRYLEAFKISGINSVACRAAGIAPSTPYSYAEDNPAFRALWTEAQKTADESLLQEARRRAVEGVQRPIYQKGLLVGYENVYSDNVLLALLKSRFPDDFADRVVIKVEPAWFEVLRRHGLTPTDAFKMMISELEKVDGPNDSEPLPEPILIGAKRVLP